MYLCIYYFVSFFVSLSLCLLVGFIVRWFIRSFACLFALSCIIAHGIMIMKVVVHAQYVKWVFFEETFSLRKLTVDITNTLKIKLFRFFQNVNI